MSLLAKLPQWFESKPLVLFRFEDGYESALQGTRHGLNRFTEVRSHDALSDVRPPTLCLAEMRDGNFSRFYVGIIKSKAAVATFDSRITIIKLKSLNLSSLSTLAESLDDKIFQTLLGQKLGHVTFATVLSPKLSAAIVDALAKDPDNKKAIEAAASHVPRLRTISIAEWEQFNAVKTAMAAFGLSAADQPEILEVIDGADSTLNYLDASFNSVEEPPEEASVLEDNVIAVDASVVQGFELKKKYVTGRAVFIHKGEQLEIYTANKGPLEEMLGVDLIYINEVTGNTVMVQYKMLTTHTDPVTVKKDWIFRPDEQFKDEVDRMKLLPVQTEPDDYRLHRSPFYFKFVKRKGDGETHASFIISLDHLNHYLATPKSKGPKGGVRISFESLDGVYLRETDLLGLIRSGYVGTHRIETKALQPIIKDVSEGKRALVLAWQRKIEEASNE